MLGIVASKADAISTAIRCPTALLTSARTLLRRAYRVLSAVPRDACIASTPSWGRLRRAISVCYVSYQARDRDQTSPRILFVAGEQT